MTMKPAPSRAGGRAAPKPPRPAPLLPHERDQALGEVAARPDPKIRQAKRDLDAGLVDTDMRATPGLDAARRRALVPGPGGEPPQTSRPAQGDRRDTRDRRRGR